MSDRATSQSDNMTPPRRSKIIALSVDSTARSYDLTVINLGKKYEAGRKDEVYLTLFADGADVYLAFHSETASNLDDTAAITAGNALAYAATYAWRLVSGTSMECRIARDVDKFIQVKTSTGTGKLRFFASSHNSAGI